MTNATTGRTMTNKQLDAVVVELEASWKVLKNMTQYELATDHGKKLRATFDRCNATLEANQK